MSASAYALFPLLALATAGLAVFGAAMLRPQAPRGLLASLAGLGPLAAGIWAVVADPADGLDRFFTGLLCLVTLATLALVSRYASRRGFAGDALFGLVPWSALGMLVLAGARDWLMLAVGLELSSLCLYALLAARLDDRLGLEAALKYFLPGAMALATLLFGISLVFAASGSLDIARSLAGGGPLAAAGLGLVLVGVGFKLSLAPVHAWTPDVYQGAPAPVAALLSTGAKVAVAAALLRLAASAPPDARGILWPALALSAGLTLAVGNLGAIGQQSLKRLLACSSIAQMGYVVMAGLAVDAGGLGAALFYLGAYAVMDLGAFGAVGALSGTGEDRDAIAVWQGLGRVYPWRAGVLAVSLASLAGLPPTAGFIGKFAVFGAALRGGYPGLAVFAALMAAVGLYYALRVVVVLFMRPGLDAEPTVPPATGWAAGLALAGLCALMLALGLVPGPLLAVIGRLAG